jgi:twitching motility two-component system response regulator PilG
LKFQISSKGIFMEGLSAHQAVDQLSSAQSTDVALKLFVHGFSQSERQMLEAIVKLSQRRQPPLTLLSETEAENADVVMIDCADIQTKKWANNQPWLKNKIVIRVDAAESFGRIVVKRPIQWPALPMLLARVLEQAPINSIAAQASTAKNNSVLVVDDSLAVRAQLRSLLEPHGLAVTEVDSAENAIKAAAASSYACILMDVLMPGIDGYEACRHIKSNTQGGNKSNVVMLTSRTSPFDRIKGKMAGCDAYLTKPIDPNYLREVISRYIATPVLNNAAT